MVRPKKSLGQHFLKDGNIARKIVSSLHTRPTETILEIGPGTGILSAILFELETPVHLIEIDPEAHAYLLERFPAQREHIHLGDFLHEMPVVLWQKPLTIIGNFPYNISSQIFFRILEHRNQVDQVVCMIQKEVADRLRSPPGRKTYGILSVLLQAYFDIDGLFNVGPQVFQPPPKVHSSVIRLRRNATRNLDCDESLFFRVVKTAFNQRRKMLRNSLQAQFPLKHSGQPIFSKRPEELDVAGFVELTRLVSQEKSR